MPKTKFVSVFTRAEEYRNEGFYVLDKFLMCKFCNVRINWERKDTCEKHCKDSVVHKKRKKEDSKESLRKQVTLVETLNAAKRLKTDKEDFVLSTTKAFVQANIPLEKLDHPDIREWMSKYIKGAGDLPQADTCRRKYVPELKEQYELDVVEAIKDKKIVIHCDETTNRNGKAVFIILFRILPNGLQTTKLFVVSVTELESADSQTCCQGIVDAMLRYRVQYCNVAGVVTDSARYMTKCVGTLKGFISGDLIHIQCWAHKLDLVAKLVPNHLLSLNKCVSMVKVAFKNARKRKHQYLSFLKAKHSDEKVKMFPIPVLTRWGSWLNSALYVGQYLEDLVEYFRTLSDSNPAVGYFIELSSNEKRCIQVEAAFVKEHCTTVSSVITFLEGCHYPTAHKLVPKVRALIGELQLVKNKVYGVETSSALEKLQGERKQREERRVQKLAGNSIAKLEKMVEEDPAKKLFQAIAQLFYLPNLVVAPVNNDLISHVQRIPLLKPVSKEDFLRGYQALQILAKSSTGTITEDIVPELLKGLMEDYPEFSRSSLETVWFPTSNVDSERGFSAYSSILSDRRTNLRPENLETMLCLYFGDNISFTS